MNSKRLVLISFFILIGTALIFGIFEFFSYKNITFDIKEEGVSIKVVRTSDNKEVAISNGSSVVKLKEGSYTYSINTEGYSDKSTDLEVTKSTTITVYPELSKDKLNALLQNTRDSVRASLVSKYPFVSNEYLFGDEQLHNKGEWYSVKLIQKVSGGNQPDVYRTVLHKEGETWKISAKPALYISINSNKSIPENVIRQVNEPLSNSAYNLLYP